MEGIIIFLFVLLGFPALKILQGSYKYFIQNEDPAIKKSFRGAEVIAIILNPLIFLLSVDTGKNNDCCTDSAFFSPDHRITIYVLIISCAAAYFYSSFRKTVAPPIIELITNCLLITGIVLNIFIIAQSEDLFWICMAGNVPVIMLFFIACSKSHQLLKNEYEPALHDSKNILEHICSRILRLNAFIKFPLLVILCVPFLCLVSVVLYIFGQRPDSAVRAFTDTYKHGLSQLDYMCDNVQCGGHYLCSVAANGHKNIVKPIRLGERNGNKIICNRQLLISNAFEELIEERWPVLHGHLRRNYDKVGDCIHRHYHLFSIKLVSDFVFIFMKPLEWFFLIILYMTDKQPESRINRQYLSTDQRMKIRMQNKRENFF